MDTEEYFPTFLGWFRAVVAPKKRVRHTLGKGKRRVVARGMFTQPITVGDNFSLEGLLKPGMDSQFSVNGADFKIDEETWIFGDLAYGVKAKIEGAVRDNGFRFASKIVIVK